MTIFKDLIGIIRFGRFVLWGSLKIHYILID